MKRAICLVVTAALALVTVAPVWGQITIRAPRLISADGLSPGFIDSFNDEIAQALGDLEDDIDDEISRYYNLPKLAQGVANAGAAATHIGTQRSFIDYRRFAFVIGGGVTASLPGTDLEMIDEIVDRLEDEDEDADVYFGAAAQPIVVSLGFRPRFISDRLYMNAKFGWADIPAGTVADEVAYNSMSAGLLANYRLVESRGAPLGLVRWRGISVGSGVVYQRSELTIDLEFDDVSEEVRYEEGADALELNMTLEPILSATVKSSSVVVPLEATTGLRVLWVLDLNVGGGVDLAFGNSEVTLDIDSPVILDGEEQITFEDGSVRVNAGTKGDGPQLVRPRLTAGAGVNLGPVRLDVPLMYYFDDDGNSFMAGVNLGIVW